MRQQPHTSRLLLLHPHHAQAGTTVFAGREPPEVAVPGLVGLISGARAKWPKAA